MYFLLPIHFFSLYVGGAFVNWFCHKFGYRNYEVNDTSTNIPFIDILGETLHNNHHKYPSRPNFAHKWFEFDGTYYIILLFSKLGIVRLKKNKA